jgi:hypothetical protein
VGERTTSWSEQEPVPIGAVSARASGSAHGSKLVLLSVPSSVLASFDTVLATFMPGTLQPPRAFRSDGDRDRYVAQPSESSPFALLGIA